MKKNFTPEQIKKGEVHYSLEEFLNDLWEEVKASLSKKDAHSLSEEGRKNDIREATKKAFYFVYEICYLAAIKKVYLDIILKKSGESEKKYIKKTIKENRDNIHLLRAILLRYIASGLNKGLSRRQATSAAMEYSKDVLNEWDQ